MENMKCKNCGSSDFNRVADYLVCNYCNSKYENKFHNNETVISLDDDVKNLINKIIEDPANRALYLNLILDIDPSNQEIKKYF